MLQLTCADVGRLQGNALMVLTILAIERGPRSLEFLDAMTGLSDKTLHRAVRKLVIMGYITEITGLKATKELSYQVIDGFRQLPLMAEELPEEVTPADDVIDLHANDARSNRNISDLPLDESMNESLTESDKDDSLIHDGAGPEIPELATEKALIELKFYGIGVKEMLSIPGLTLREVRYQVAHSPNLGCALARIRKRQPIPDNWERAGPDTLASAGDRRKYIDGEFADFIKH